MKLPLILGLIMVIAVMGTGIYVTDFTAYLGDNPSTCNNCHVMDAAYEGWYHAGHKGWAKCNDCHTPHSLIPKYWVKAMSGYHHVSAFMLDDIPDAIRAKEASRDVVQENCIRCHTDTVMNIADGGAMPDYELAYGSQTENERRCFECHRSVAHGNRGISLLPYQHSEENK